MLALIYLGVKMLPQGCQFCNPAYHSVFPTKILFDVDLL